MRRTGVSALVWSLALLTIFFTVIRSLGERTRPVEAALDCDRVAAGDSPTLERCIEVRPGDVELMAELGQSYEQAVRWDLAEAIYRRALESDPEDGDIRVRLAHVLLQRGDAAGARREGMAALVVQPGRAAVLEVIRLAAAAEAGQ